MKQSICLGTILLTVSLTSSFAQQSEQPTTDVMFVQDGPMTQVAPVGPPDSGYARQVLVTGAGPNVMFMGGGIPFEDNPVKGAPYSADSISETVQTLADGNRIVQSSTSKVYRDSSGRTRRESDGKAMPAGGFFFQTFGPVTDEKGAVSVGAAGRVGGGMAVAGAMSGQPAAFRAQTVINDPVARVSYVLDPNTHTAQKINMPPSPTQDPAMAAAVAKAEQEMMATGQGSVTINDAGKTVVIGMKRNTAEGSSVGSSTESLGTDTIEGVECEGTRTTLTIPAGQIGNEQPIAITNERWYSPKLQTVVLSKRHDPRSGDTTFRLMNIDQSEPSASLFQIPADYTIVDVGAEINAKIKANEANRK